MNVYYSIAFQNQHTLADHMVLYLLPRGDCQHFTHINMYFVHLQLNIFSKSFEQLRPPRLIEINSTKEKQAFLYVLYKKRFKQLLVSSTRTKWLSS